MAGAWCNRRLLGIHIHNPRCPQQGSCSKGTKPIAQLIGSRAVAYCELTLEMYDLSERCGKHRVARLLKIEGLRSQTGYGRRPGTRGGKPAVVAPNHL